MVRVDLRKLTLGQRLEGNERAGHMNILKKSVLEGESQHKGSEAGTCLVYMRNKRCQCDWGLTSWMMLEKKMGEFMY